MVSPVIEEVRHRLHDFASEIRYEKHTERETSVKDILFYAASQCDKYSELLYPGIEGLSLHSTNNNITIIRNWENMKFLKSNRNHSGRNCGRKFGIDEPIYRCHDCGFDDTCVLCVHCFNKEDHIGHQVTTSIASSRNTGICDCGDPEAWTRELHCKCENDIEEDEHITIFDDSYKNYLKQLFDVCLEFIIQTFAHENQTLLSVYPNVVQQGPGILEEELEHTERAFRRIHTPRKKNNTDFFLVFWNDEVHNYEEAQHALQTCGGITPRQSLNSAQKINDHGRIVLLERGSTSQLDAPLLSSFSLDFPATIMTEEHYCREEIASIIVEWFQLIMNHSNLSFQKAVRRALCESLCGEYVISQEFAPFWQKDRLGPDYGGLLEGAELPSDFLTTKNGVHLPPSVFESTRLKYIAFFEPRYWKHLRSQVHSFLVSSLLSDMEYKITSTVQMIDIYGLLLRNILSFDREPTVTFLDDFAVQFLTCPKSTSAITEYSLERLVTACADIFSRMLASDKPTIRMWYKAIDRRSQKRVAQSIVLRSLNHIFDKSTNIGPLFTTNAFHSFCKIVSYCDNCYEITRKEGDHVENENMDYLLYHEIVKRVIDIIMYATEYEKLSKVDVDLLKSCVVKLLTNLYGGIKDKTMRDENKLIKFKLSSSQVGFYFPSHFLLGKLLSFIGISSDTLRDLVKCINYELVADVALRRIALNAQIQSRFWIRNGSSVLHLSSGYTGIYNSADDDDNQFTRDIYLNQVAMITQDPEHYFRNLLARFELLRWFKRGDLGSTIYENKVTNILEHFIAFVYSLLVERVNFMKFESKEDLAEYKLCKLLRYMLFTRPLSYTEIEELVNDSVLANDTFERALRELTTYSPPKGFEDEGMYALKKEEYKHVDPMALAAQGQDLSNNIHVIVKALSGGAHEDNVILMPQVEEVPPYGGSLGEFTRTHSFTKFISLILQHSLDNDDEANLGVLLHLLHAAILDSEIVYGTNSVLEIYVEDGIYMLLFSIVQKGTFSNALIHKADFLLENFFFKDSKRITDGLIQAYGEDAVNMYKKKKESTGVHFDETDIERKKRLAKERQERLFNKMKKKQKAFINKNDTEPADDASSDHQSHEDHRQCVMCQGFESSEKPMMAPVTFIESDVFKKLPDADELYFKRAFKNWGDDTLEPSEEFVGQLFSSDGSMDLTVLTSVAVSCNHGFHYSCLQDFRARSNFTARSRFPCPLCKMKNDIYVPILFGQNISPELLNKAVADDDTIASVILEEAFENQGAEVSKDLYGNFKESFSSNSEDGLRTEACKTWGIFGSSIAQAEISTRINGQSAYTDFLNQIPEQTYILLRTLFQYCLLLHREGIYDDENLHKYLAKLIDSKCMIHTFVMYFFSGSDGLKLLVCQLVTLYADKYIKILCTDSKAIECEPFLAVDEELISSFRQLVTGDVQSNLNIEDLKTFHNDDKKAESIIAMVERFLIVDLRNIAIFLKVLVPAFDITFTEEAFNIDTLLKGLELPSLREIIDSEESREVFQFSGEKLKGHLRYPGVIKLVDLPRELSYFATSTGDSYDPTVFPSFDAPTNASNRIDFMICLMCGHKVYNSSTPSGIQNHFNDCTSSGTAIFLNPTTDEVKLWSKKGKVYYNKVVNAPYLNDHGQSGRHAVMNGRVAILNLDRLKYLTNMWLSGSIYPYLTRVERPHSLVGSRGGFQPGVTDLWENLLRQAVDVRGIPAGMTQETFFDMMRNGVADALADEGGEDISDGPFGWNSAFEEDDEDYTSENDNDHDDDEEEDVFHSANDHESHSDSGDSEARRDVMAFMNRLRRQDAISSGSEDDDYHEDDEEGHMDADEDHWVDDDGPSLDGSEGGDDDDGHPFPLPAFGANAREWLAGFGDGYVEDYDDEDELDDEYDEFNVAEDQYIAQLADEIYRRRLGQLANEQPLVNERLQGNERPQANNNQYRNVHLERRDSHERIPASSLEEDHNDDDYSIGSVD
jgi:E3 ubiquitin-protein ligase UBR1